MRGVGFEVGKCSMQRISPWASLQRASNPATPAQDTGGGGVGDGEASGVYVSRKASVSMTKDFGVGWVTVN